MSETMGQIIRRLRKERNLTQEELAEQLNVTFQAVSRWENGTGMPDISQIVPLARVFGVSTDVLFGTVGVNDKEEVWKIINNAQSLLTRPLDSTGLLKKYAALQEGLKIYPNNPILLLECLETGIALAYPENDVYSPDYAEIIYQECIRMANLVISYSPNTNDILRAHMIMVLLHSAYGNYNDALLHAKHFPTRADFNIHVMYAYYAHHKKDYETEAASCQFGIAHYLEGLLNILTRLGQTYALLENYEDATETLETALALIECIFAGDEIKPPLHHREEGDIYMLLADIYLKRGDRGTAISYIEKMVDYDTVTYEKIDPDTKTISPLLRARAHEFYIKRIDRYENLIAKLTDERFDSLKDEQRYQQLLASVISS